MKKRIVISVSNDLSIDQRVHRVCTTLHREGYDVLLVGRLRYNSRPLSPRPYRTRRMRLLFDRGKLFYLSFNFRLFWFLLFRKCDILLANDLDTLLPNVMVGKLRRKKIVYDSHELWTELPELQERNFTRRLWTWLERRLFPRVHAAYTVNDSIAEYYKERYQVDVRTVRNLPLRKTDMQQHERLPAAKVLLYQGALNTGRGIELMIAAMQYLEGYRLIVVGFGTEEEVLPKLAGALGVSERVEFKGYVPFEHLTPITRTAVLGFSLEEDRGLSYRYALPNKMMDYIQAHVPVLVSDLPEMRAVVDGHRVGEVLNMEERNPETLAARVRGMVEDAEKWMVYHNNCVEAAKELCWEMEEPRLLEVLT